MSTFINSLSESIARYLDLQHSLGYQFVTQATSLRALLRHVRITHARGPLSQALALECVMASDITPNGKAIRYAVIRRFAQFHAAFDSRTQPFDRRVLPRSRAIPPPRILTDQELLELMAASKEVAKYRSMRGDTLATIVGLLASTGLRSGEAVRLDCTDVDLTRGILHVRKTKFRKDRLVPVHPTTINALRDYACHRNRAFPTAKTPAFFISTRGTRLLQGGLCYGLKQACAIAGLNRLGAKTLRPHDLRHRFAVTRLAEWHRRKIDVQTMLPLLATYLGHARYSDTAYYISATSELLGLAAGKAFANRGAA